MAYRRQAGVEKSRQKNYKRRFITMIKFSKNAKLNNALYGIYEQLKEYDTDTETGKSTGEIKRYYQEFKNGGEKDYNIAQYGNLLIYYSDIYKFYADCGYKTTAKLSTAKIWDLYLRQVGYVVRNYFINK